MAHALKALNNLGCWLAKQTNATSSALTGLLTVVDSVRRDTLQNRSAIDFLLLAHGHGCEDFVGLCCMNLSDNSLSIHANIQALRDSVTKLRVVDDSDCLGHILGGQGLTGWLKHLAKTGIYILAILLLMMICLPCVLQCIQRLIDKSTKEILLVEKKGGHVEIQLES